MRDWWDYSDDELSAMTVEELRDAYERALRDVQPAHDAATTPAGPLVLGKPVPVLRPDQVEAIGHAQRVQGRYERLRDAFYLRRNG